MSFEGYYQRLCKSGHPMNTNFYMADDDDECKRCGEPVAWKHFVDQTNDGGHPIHLEVLEQRICPCCDSVLETCFKIPEMQTANYKMQNDGTEPLNDLEQALVEACNAESPSLAKDEKPPTVPSVEELAKNLNCWLGGMELDEWQDELTLDQFWRDENCTPEWKRDDFRFAVQKIIEHLALKHTAEEKPPTASIGEKKMKLLERANQVLRSAYAIAVREGRETNWPAFRDQVDALLLDMHDEALRTSPSHLQTEEKPPHNVLSEGKEIYYILKDDIDRVQEGCDLGDSVGVRVYLYPHRSMMPKLAKLERVESPLSSSRKEEKEEPTPRLSGDDLPKLHYKYDECVEVFWTNPWSNQEERLFMMMWPGHPIEETSTVERWFEEYAKRFTLIAESVSDESAKLNEDLDWKTCALKSEKRIAELEAEIARLKGES